MRKNSKNLGKILDGPDFTTMMKTNEDRNVIGVLGGHSEFLESDSKHQRARGVFRAQGFG